MESICAALLFLMFSSCTSVKENSEEKDTKQNLEWIIGEKSLPTEIVFLKSTRVEEQLTNIKGSLNEFFTKTG